MQTGQYKNTVIVVMSDNRAASGAGQKGNFEQIYAPNKLTPEQMLARIVNISSRLTRTPYPPIEGAAQSLLVS